jgi:cytosine/adenosine deaminase-related metal-dependent hydrolase
VAISLRARIVFPVDRPPIENGVVTIDGERIVDVGNEHAHSEEIDLGSVALMPGLVNAHTHLEFSGLVRPLGAPQTPLPDWIRLVIAQRSQRGAAANDAIAAGLRESLSHGVTTIGEIAASEPTAYSGTEIASDVDATLFAEVIGFSRARAESAFAAVTARLNDLQSMAPHCRFGISPHAPYTVSPLLLQRLVELARKRDMPVAMHLAESAEELEFLHSGTGPFQDLLDERGMWDPNTVPHGSQPFDYLCLLANAPRTLVIHGNYLDAAEREFLATHRDRMSLVYCPRTHEYFGHPPYPLAELLTAGVNVALGTDSRASNPDLDLLAEMRHVARYYAAIRPQEVLRMGTLAGAEALGRDDVGSISPGKLANLVAVPLSIESPQIPTDMLEAILNQQVKPTRVWLRGREVPPGP